MTRALAVVALAALGACRGGRLVPDYAAVTGGDPARGRELVANRHCGVCHVIPGVTGAFGVIGPPLAAVARRGVIGPGLPNSTANLVRWIRDPEGLDPRSAMPNLSLDEGQARDVAAYLVGLREAP